MELQHVNVKVFVEGEPTVSMEKVVELFHEWVSEQACDELLIDVADYLHVPDGPGIVLVGHEADYGLDQQGGRWGLLYNRKDRVEGSNEERLSQAINAALKACDRLESSLSGIKFSRTEFDVVINDRAYAPNTAETLAAAKPIIEGYLNGLIGEGGYSLTHHDAPRSRFGFSVKANSAIAV